MNLSEIITAINKYVSVAGGALNSWYVGITKNPDNRLFNEHNVDKSNGIWIHCPADSNEIARNVESFFLRQGMDGGPGGGDWESRYVYSYKKGYETNP